jgi:hypothetical protein
MAVGAAVVSVQTSRLILAAILYIISMWCNGHNVRFETRVAYWHEWSRGSIPRAFIAPKFCIVYASVMAYILGLCIG